MKSLNSFFAALFTLILIVSCSDSSTGPGDFQQRRVGTWLITSENTAKWVGGHDNLKDSPRLASVGDSIYYNQPDHNSLRLVTFPDPDTLYINYVYVDSTMTLDWYDTTMASPYVYPFIDGEPMGGSGQFKEDYTLLESGFPFSCDSTYAGVPATMSLAVKSDTGGVYQRRFFDVSGIYQAADDMICH